MNFSHFNKVVFAASLLATGFSYADSDRPLLSLSVSQSGGTALNSEGSLDTRTPEANRAYYLSGVMKLAPVVMIYQSHLE